MKNLSEYIQDNKEEYHFIRYSIMPEYSFEQFCEDNNVDFSNQKMYTEALEYFESRLWFFSGMGEWLDYRAMQGIFYETLSHSLSTDKMRAELQKKLKDKIYLIERFESGKTLNVPLYPITIISIEDLRYNETFDSILNFYNYCIYRVYKDQKKYRFVLRPNFSDEKTEFIHSQKYLFHVTTKGKLNKVIKTGFHPVRNENTSDEPSKFYVFTEFKELSNCIKDICNFKKRLLDNPSADYNELYITVIDVSKLKKEQRFFRDETYDGAQAFYTYEPILPSAIKGYVNITNDDLKSLDNINKLIEKLKK